MKYVDYVFLCIVAIFIIGEKAESMKSWVNAMFLSIYWHLFFQYTPEHLSAGLPYFFKWITSLFTSYHFTSILQNNEVVVCILTVWLELI